MHVRPSPNSPPLPFSSLRLPSSPVTSIFLFPILIFLIVSPFSLSLPRASLPPLNLPHLFFLSKFLVSASPSFSFSIPFSGLFPVPPSPPCNFHILFFNCFPLFPIVSTFSVFLPPSLQSPSFGFSCSHLPSSPATFLFLCPKSSLTRRFYSTFLFFNSRHLPPCPTAALFHFLFPAPRSRP